jgi:streptogrisin C
VTTLRMVRAGTAAIGILAAAACMPPPPPLPQVPPPAPAPPPDDHTVTMGADVLVQVYGLGRDEALRRMRAQPAAIAAALDLQARLGLAEGRVWIDHRNGGQVIARTDAVAAAEVAAAVEQAHAVDVVAAPTDRSADQIAEVADQLTTDLDAGGVEGFTVNYDAQADVFEVDVPPAPDAAEPPPIEVAEDAAANAGLDPGDVTVEAVDGIQPAICSVDGRHCDAPLRGATAIRGRVGTSLVYCSAGFSARTPGDGAYLLMTAGHCVSGNASQATWTEYQPSTSRWVDLGSFAAGLYGLGGDAAIVRVTDAAGWAPGPSIVAGPAATARAASLSEAYRVDDDQHPVVGAVLCLSGASSGTSCGEVTAVGVTVSYAGPGGSRTLVERLGRIELRELGKMCTGDSGGPVYANGLGFGIISGGALGTPERIQTDVYGLNVTCGRTVVLFQDLPLAAERLGVLVGARDWRDRLGWSG